MKKLVLVLAIVALMAAPAAADITRSQTLNGNMSTFSLGNTQGSIDPRSVPVYAFTNTNGYYHAFTAPDAWDGEYVITTEAAAWTMDSFSVGWYAPAGAPQTQLYVDFYSNDGYLPWSGNHIAGFTIPVTADGYAHIGTYATNVAMPTNAVWATYSWNVAGAAAPNMGPLHVGLPNPDPGAQVGTDVYEDGWIEYDGTTATNNVHWWWYGGNPSSDLFLQMTPEPGSLILLAVGALALLRRR